MTALASWRDGSGSPAEKGRQALRLLVLHDDPEREFDDVKGAEHALARAGKEGWTVVSVTNDWATVFADQEGATA